MLRARTPWAWGKLLNCSIINVVEALRHRMASNAHIGGFAVLAPLGTVAAQNHIH